jgi:UDP-GlcNAc:undecaprenyl-phosphate GlcNAc-1-phosphate transferase
MLDYILLLISLFLFSLGITLLFLKHFIKFYKENNFLDKTDDRKTHLFPTPSSGGLAFGIVIILALPLLLKYTDQQIPIFCSFILLILGYLDDKYDLSVKLKFSIQIMVTIVTISFIGPISLMDTNPLYFNHIITFFFILGFTNSYNLIDGIDGLAGLYGVFILALLSFIFILDKNYSTSIITIILIASLIGFLKYNLKSAKVFMGDTGSLFIGFLITTFTVTAINEHPISSFYLANNNSLHLVLLAALILPMFDTIRVMLIRILKGNSPFKADRIHLHHLLGKIGMTHLQITLSFLFISIFIMLFTMLLVILNLNFIFIIISIISVITLILNAILYVRIKQHQSRIKDYQNSLKFIIENNYLIKGNTWRTELK